VTSHSGRKPTLTSGETADVCEGLLEQDSLAARHFLLQLG
jgi:hypothetical protein